MTERPHNNANPRKFKEKIELLQQKEAQLTANFVEVMRGIPALTRHVVPCPESLDKELQQSVKSSGLRSKRNTSSTYQCLCESSTVASNRVGNAISGERDEGQFSRIDGVRSQPQPRQPSSSQPRKIDLETVTSGRPQTITEPEDSSLFRISPRVSQSASPSAYQPNMGSISVPPQSPRFYAESSRQCAPEFHQPPPPPLHSLCPLDPISEQTFRGYASQSTWGFPTTQNCDEGTVGSSLAPMPMIGGMSLMDYRRTYSDSCIPNNFPEALSPSRRFPPCHQYRRLQQQQQHTLPPVDEFTGSRYENVNPNAALNNFHTSSNFNGGPIPSPRCRHQSSTTVYQQPSKRLQLAYHSMRNIPQRYAPVHRSRRNLQQTSTMSPVATPILSQMIPTTADEEKYDPRSLSQRYHQTWTMNGGPEAAPVSAYDLPSSSPGLNLKRSGVYEHCRSKAPVPQISTNRSTAADVLAYHSFTPTTLVANINNANNPSVCPTHSFDVNVIDMDTFPSQEQEGRRDSFSMAVDLLSRLEKRPFDSYLATPCTTSSSLPSLSTAIATASQGGRALASSPPLKASRFDSFATYPTGTTTDTATAAFYVPIAANDLQLLTEPSMANYVTDAATEDQLVREQYS